MRNNKLIWQIYLPLFLVCLAMLLSVSWYISTAVKSFYLDEATRQLEEKARLTAPAIVSMVAQHNMAGLAAYFRETGNFSQTRFTVIALSGSILADSLEDPVRMENHADRPEIKAALDSGRGNSIRFSFTLNQFMMYVAIPLNDGTNRIGVLRTAVSISTIDAALKGIRSGIYWTTAFFALLFGIVSWKIALRIITPLHRIRHEAEHFSTGDLTRKLPTTGPEEFVALSRTLNSMAEELGSTIKAITQQRNQLNAIFTSMVEGVLVFDNQERLVNINKTGADLLDIDQENFINRNLLEVIRNIDLQKFVSRTINAAGTLEGEISLKEADSERYFQLHGTRLQDSLNHAAGSLIVINEVTSIRKLERVRRDFVANVSHELKTPITSIKGFVETLIDGALENPPDARRFLGIILRQTERLDAIISDLLALSRIELKAEKNKVELTKNSICDALHGAIASCTRMAEDKKTLIKCSCPSSLNAPINPPLLEQAIFNLLDNAIKYSPVGSKIDVKAEQQSGQVLIHITDNGPGIPLEHQGRIFERFYRVDKSRSNKTEGTGLGLSIVKHIAQAHGGEISVKSEVGKGTTFSIRLPS